MKRPQRLSVTLFALGILEAACVQALAIDFDTLKPSIPRILTIQKEGMSSGSGFVIASSEQGSFVATNYHVVADRADNGAIAVTRLVSDNVIEILPSKIALEFPAYDLAILLVPSLDAPPLTFQLNDVKQGVDVFAVGYPGVADDPNLEKAFFSQAGSLIVKALTEQTPTRIPDVRGHASRFLEVSVQKGAVRRVVERSWGHGNSRALIRAIETDVNINHGNSGGPLVDDTGCVIGVNTAGRSGEDGDQVKFSSHAEVLVKILQANGIVFKTAPSAGNSPSAPDTPVPSTEAAPTHIPPPVPGVSLQPQANAPSNGPTEVVPPDSARPAPSFAAKSDSTWIIVIAVGVLAVGTIMALQRKDRIVETYTQYVRRVGKHSNERYTSTSRSSIRSPPSKKAWELEGVNPEDNSHFALRIDSALVRSARGKILVGRNRREVHLQLRNTSVSGRHAMFHVDSNGDLYLEDLNSSNGTRVDELRLKPGEKARIRNNTKVSFGELSVRIVWRNGT